MEELIEKNETEEITEATESSYTYICNPLELPDEYIKAISQSKGFASGVDFASELLGIYTTLANCGVSLEDAVSIVSNKMVLDYNIKLQKEVNEGLKYQSSVMKESNL